jgi:hypothetical protein
VSLQGVLSDFGIADVFQLIAQQRKTGVLTLENEGRTLEVHFSEGSVVRARPGDTAPDAALAEFLLRTGAISEQALVEAQRRQEQSPAPLAEVLVGSRALAQEELERVVRLVTHETIFELFLWEQGSFRFRPQDLPEEPGDELIGAELLLLDALRMRDEWAQIRMRLPELAVTIAPVADAEAFSSRRERVESASGLSEEEVARLFHLADGRISARRIIDLSRLGTFLGAKGLVELLRLGMLRIQRPQVRAAAEAAPVTRARPALAVWALAAAALTAGALLLWPEPRTMDRPLPADALERARTQMNEETLRTVLEVHAWAEGNYPESLHELRGPADLAPSPSRRYHYARSREGYALHADP